VIHGVDEDPLDALRRVWAALPGDVDGEPAEALAACDAATREAVARVRRAWLAQSAVVPPLPLDLARLAHAGRARAWRARRRARRVASLAAAAAVVVALGTLRPWTRVTSGEAAMTGTTASAPSPETAAPRAVAEAPATMHEAASYLDIPRASVHVRADGVEFESGGVRFVLIDTHGEAAAK